MTNDNGVLSKESKCMTQMVDFLDIPESKVQILGLRSPAAAHNKQVPAEKSIS